jgi:hypothetical protein
MTALSHLAFLVERSLSHALAPGPICATATSGGSGPGYSPSDEATTADVVELTRQAFERRGIAVLDAATALAELEGPSGV